MRTCCGKPSWPLGGTRDRKRAHPGSQMVYFLLCAGYKPFHVLARPLYPVKVGHSGDGLEYATTFRVHSLYGQVARFEGVDLFLEPLDFLLDFIYPLGLRLH